MQRTRFLILSFAVVSMIALTACGDDATVSPAPSATTTPAEGTERLWIASETATCQGEAPQTCLVVRRTADGPEEFFYDPIDGFTHVPGVAAVIDVEVTEIPDPPADGSSLAYRLVEIVSETVAD